MTLGGTVINGVVAWDGGATVPDGTHFIVDDEKFEYPHPMAPYDLEKEVALLQKSHDEMKAGVRGQTLDEFMAELRRDYALPSMPVE